VETVLSLEVRSAMTTIQGMEMDVTISVEWNRNIFAKASHQLATPVFSTASNVLTTLLARSVII